jgi:hypothetical protein
MCAAPDRHYLAALAILANEKSTETFLNPVRISPVITMNASGWASLNCFLGINIELQ